MKRFIKGSGQLDRNCSGFMDLLKYIKAVLRFGLFCQYLVAVTRSSISFSPFFERLSGADIEKNSKDELVVSLGVKNLYTKVPSEEAIEIALKELYSSDEIPEIPRSAMKSLFRQALDNV